MKTKLSKKILSAFLAVLMIVTSVPMTAFNAYADFGTLVVDPAVVAIESAMKKFESKLQTEGAYTNVVQAYNAYVDCQKALDAYLYGGETDALNGKAKALTDAIGEIGNYTGVAGAADAVNQKDASDYARVWANDSSDATTYYKNVLWSETRYNTACGSNTSINSRGGSEDMELTTLYYPEVTMLYDGVNTPQATMFTMTQGYKYSGSQSYNKKSRYINTVMMNTDGLALNQNWKGSCSDAEPFNAYWALGYGDKNISYTTSRNGGSVYRVYYKKLIDESIELDTYRWANTYQYTGALNDTTYSVDIYPAVKAVYGSNANFTSNDVNAVVTGNKAIHVINYKVLADQIATSGTSMKSIAVSDYSEGGLLNYVTAMDNATGFDVLSNFKVANNYADCANRIKAYVEALKNVKTTKNSDNYRTLRTAMSEDVRSIYKGGNTGYTDDSWSAFVTAYEKAQSVMAACNDSTGYNSTQDLVAIANNLTAARGNLETNVTKVNTDALMSAIDTIIGYDDIFTDASYNAVISVIDNAKTGVWGNVDNYGIPTEALDDKDGNQAVVDGWTDAIKEEAKSLRIDPSAIIETANGRVSLNDAIALADGLDPSDYSNYSTFNSAITEAQNYVTTIANTEFTDYAAQRSAYIAMIEKVYKAYYALELSFMKIPDGTIVKVEDNSNISLEDTGHSGECKMSFDFSYPSGAIVFKTNHSNNTVKIGNTSLRYGTNTSNLNNNMLDGITINSTAVSKSEINYNNSSTPGALNDAQYAAQLSKDGFSFNNFTISDTNRYYDRNGLGYFAIKADGTRITDSHIADSTFTDMLATVEGQSSNPGVGGIFVKSTSSEYAYITLEGDMNFDIPAVPQQTLDANTRPTSTPYTLNGNFGATYIWNVKVTALNYSGYGYQSTYDANNPTTYKVAPTVTVIDMSYLVDLVNLCLDKLADEDRYTIRTWKTFTDALTNAQSNLNYSTMDAATILQRIQSRYTTLWNAYQGLTEKTLNVSFNYKDANGADALTHFTAKYGETVNDHASEFDAINTPPQYVEGNSTYTFSGWSPALDKNAPIKDDIVYTAQYTATLNQAVFNAYNTARAELIGALTPDTYTVADLLKIADEIAGYRYFLYTDEQKEATMADEQDAIDAETAKIRAIIDGLQTPDYDLSYAIATGDAAKDAKVDTDRFDLSSLDFKYQENVKITDTITVSGLVFETKDQLEATIREALESLATSIRVYDITVVTADGTKVIKDIPYGTPVIVNSDGSYELNVLDTDANYDGNIASWTYSYDAPSRGNLGPTTPKYMLAAPSLGFIVRGNTFLTAALEDTADTTYLVTVKTDFGKIIDVQSVAGEYTMPETEKLMFTNYIFDGFDNGAAAGATIPVTQDTTIIAQYTEKTIGTYTIDVCDSYDAYWNFESTASSYKYNQKVSVSNPDAFCWVVAEYDGNETTLNVKSYGSDYSFYACENINITDVDTFTGKALVPLTYDEYCNVIMSSSTLTGYGAVLENGNADAFLVDDAGNKILATAATNESGAYELKVEAPKASVTSLSKIVGSADKSHFTLVGQFMLPEGAEIVECGFIFTTDKNVTDLTVENVDNANGVFRFKSTKYTCGNQFTADVVNPSTRVNFNYAPYAIVKNADGNVSIVYGTSRVNITNRF